MSRRTEADGMVAVTARLTPEEAGPVGAVIDRRVASTRAPAGASLAQQRAGALVVAVTTGGTIAAEAVVHVRPSGNTCGARSFLPSDHVRPYRDGGPTTIADLRRLCGEHNRAGESGRLWS